MVAGDEANGKHTEDDLAWVDSCFSKYPNTLDSVWKTLRDALMETIEVRDTFPEDGESANVASQEGTFGKDYSVDSQITGTESDHELSSESADNIWLSHKTDIFLPTYRGESLELGTSDAEIDSDHEPLQWDPSLEDIFKTWELAVPPPEELSLVKQLKKFLEDGLTEKWDDVSVEWDSSNYHFVDEIVSGIADLSLSQDPVGNLLVSMPSQIQN